MRRKFSTESFIRQIKAALSLSGANERAAVCQALPTIHQTEFCCLAALHPFALIKIIFMKQQFYLLAKSTMLAATFIFLQSYSFKLGGDYFKVLLNGRMVTEQYLTRPVPMNALSLTSSNRNDQLTIYYSHCGQAGKGRSISIKDGQGKILKEWKFNDSKSQQMQLSVAEILNASLKQHSVILYYASKEIPSGRQIITLDLSSIALLRR